MKYKEALRALREGGNPLADWGLTENECLKYRAILNLTLREASKEKRYAAEAGK